MELGSECIVKLEYGMAICIVKSHYGMAICTVKLQYGMAIYICIVKLDYR